MQNAIRFSFLANGVLCLLGGVGYVLQITWLVFLTINPGMGGAVLAATVGLTFLFRRALDKRVNFGHNQH